MNEQLDIDLAMLLTQLDRLSLVFMDGRTTSEDETSRLAYRRVGGAIDRLITKAKLERHLNNQGKSKR